MTTEALFPHQLQAAEFLAARRCALLADEPRVGKTPATVRACDIVGAKRILVLCPAIARLDWARKFAQFGGTPRHVECVFSAGDTIHAAPEVLVSSYALAESLQHLTQIGALDVLILDEAHYLKSVTAKRTKVVLGTNGLVHKARRVWFLTGTPAPNNVAELWPMLYVSGRYAKNYAAFTRDFCTGYHTQWGYQITGTKNAEALRELMSGFILRRPLESVYAEMPELNYSHFSVQASEPVSVESAAVYKSLSMVDVGAQDAPRLAVHAQALSTWRREVGLKKAPLAVERVKYLRLPKLVLFAVHRDVIESLQNQLRAYNPAVLHGSVTADAREKELFRFRDDGTCRVMIAQIQTAGTAVDMSAADHALIVEASFTPGDNEQAANRLRNILKRRPCFVEFFSIAGGLDEKIHRILNRKSAGLCELWPDLS